jgi:hypothetical protein
MDLVEKLDAIEDIKNLKARYFRFMDLKMWDEWAMVFAENCTLSYFDKTHHSRAEIVETVSNNMRQGVTVHHGHTPEITVTSPDEASGVWAMADYNEFQAGPMGAGASRGYGHYYETYVRHPRDGWQIASVRLDYIRVDHAER